MFRIPILLLSTAIILFAGSCGTGGIPAVELPETRPAPALAETARASQPTNNVDETGIVDIPEIRVGSFERPESVPGYEIMEREPADRDGAHAVRLLVDTRARTKAEFEVIAQDLKARHADYDAVSIEFTDTSGVLDYNGAAVIFNTPAGVSYIGYVYGPPNNRGVYAEAAE